MEVTFAIVILSSALVVLVGLQSAVAERSIYDDNRKVAMHFSRQILAAIETREASQEPLEDQNTVETAEVMLQNILGTNVPPIQNVRPPSIELQAQLIVGPWGIPDVADNLMKKIELTLFWSDSPRDQFRTVFFMPIP